MMRRTYFRLWVILTIYAAALCYSPIALGQQVNASELINHYQRNQQKMQQKTERLFFKNIDLSLAPCIDGKATLRKRNLSYLPVLTYRLKNKQLDTTDLLNVIKHISIRKSKVDFSYVIDNDQYLGFFVTQERPLHDISSIQCDSPLSSHYHKWYAKDLALIRDFKPDIIFQIDKARFNTMMIKNNELFFLGYMNGQTDQERYVIVPYKEWQKGLKNKYGYSWTRLIDKKLYQKNK